MKSLMTSLRKKPRIYNGQPTLYNDSRHHSRPLAIMLIPPLLPLPSSFYQPQPLYALLGSRQGFGHTGLASEQMHMTGMCGSIPWIYRA